MWPPPDVSHLVCVYLIGLMYEFYLTTVAGKKTKCSFGSKSLMREKVHSFGIGSPSPRLCCQIHSAVADGPGS